MLTKVLFPLLFGFAAAWWFYFRGTEVYPYWLPIFVIATLVGTLVGFEVANRLGKVFATEWKLQETIALERMLDGNLLLIFHTDPDEYDEAYFFRKHADPDMGYRPDSMFIDETVGIDGYMGENSPRLEIRRKIFSEPLGWLFASGIGEERATFFVPRTSTKLILNGEAPSV